MIDLTISSPISGRISKMDADKIAPCLTYSYTIWREGQKGKKPFSIKKTMWADRGDDCFYFWSGHLDRIRNYLDQEKIPHRVLYPDFSLPFVRPGLPGITFRSDQIKLIRAALRCQRGVILSPTGTGKTIIQMGLVSAYRNLRTLILAHTNDLVNQAKEELDKFGLIADVSTMQSYVKIPVKNRCDRYDVIISDECHHYAKDMNTYGKIMSGQLAPIRLGFTATMPSEKESILSLEGHLGPVIGEYTMKEAMDDGILAVPKIRIIKSPKISVWGSWPEVYKIAVVNNKKKNNLIKKIAKEYMNEGKIVLIMVHRIEHGEILQKLLRIPFVEGRVNAQDRLKIKKQLIEKKLKGAICTTVWREGINIPSLDVVINAAGGASEILTLQGIGRGLRKTDDKDQVIIVDIFDPSNNYLIKHFSERLCLYCDNDWI